MLDRILRLLAVEHGHFAFESGHHGTTWMDLEALFLHPAEVEPLASELAAAVRPFGAEVVCGPLVEGAFLAIMVARLLQVPFTYSERFSHNPGELYPYGYRIPRTLHPHVAGRRVLIINDVISAGSAVRGTAIELERLGANVVGIGALLLLGDWTASFAREKSLQVAALAHRDHDLWPPSECPLCAGGVPVQARVQSV
jgi:orotate phosphoribosyltransferase